MSIAKERDAAMKLLKKEIRSATIKGIAKRMRMPFTTVRRIANGESTGTIKTWIRIEKYLGVK